MLLERAVDEEWSAVEHLLAAIAEISHSQLRAQLAAGGVRESKLPKPLEIPRPAAPSRPRRASHQHATTDDLRRWFKKR